MEFHGTVKSLYTT